MIVCYKNTTSTLQASAHKHKPCIRTLYISLSHRFFQLLRINPIQCVYIVGSIVAYGHSRNTATHINPFAIGVIVFEFVTTQMFPIILQHYSNIRNVRIFPPRFFDSGQEVSRLPYYIKHMPITPLHGLHLPTRHEPLFTPDKMLVAFPTLLALVGLVHDYKQIVLNINSCIKSTKK